MSQIEFRQREVEKDAWVRRPAAWAVSRSLTTTCWPTWFSSQCTPECRRCRKPRCRTYAPLSRNSREIPADNCWPLYTTTSKHICVISLTTRHPVLYIVCFLNRGVMSITEIVGLNGFTVHIYNTCGSIMPLLYVHILCASDHWKSELTIQKIGRLSRSKGITGYLCSKQIINLFCYPICTLYLKNHAPMLTAVLNRYHMFY